MKSRPAGFDPVLNKTLQFVGTFRWDGLHRDERQMALRRQSIANGMEFGYRAAEKPGVETRKEAAMTALVQGIIDTRHFPNAGFGHDTKRTRSGPGLFATSHVG